VPRIGRTLEYHDLEAPLSRAPGNGEADRTAADHGDVK
jgi:hypothetical protein